MQASLTKSAHHRHRFAVGRNLAQWILAGMVHGRRYCHRPGQEGLYLIGAVAVLLQPQGQVEHVLVGSAGMSSDKVGNQILFLAGGLGILVEERLEPEIRIDARLHHF